jgi:hypothetical protein
MDKVRLILTVVSIVIIVVPIVGVVLMYQNNLLGLIIPPQINDIMDSLKGGGNSGGGNNSGNPQIVGEPQYNPASRTVTLTFQYTNPFSFSVTIKSMSGNILCHVDDFPLGNASLSKPVSMGAGETAMLTVQGTWTDAAINHFGSVHAGQKTVTVDLVDVAVDVSGVKIQTDQRIPISDVPIP